MSSYSRLAGRNGARKSTPSHPGDFLHKDDYCTDCFRAFEPGEIGNSFYSRMEVNSYECFKICDGCDDRDTLCSTYERTLNYEEDIRVVRCAFCGCSDKMSGLTIIVAHVVGKGSMSLGVLDQRGIIHCNLE
jgi:hypothetical protein